MCQQRKCPAFSKRSLSSFETLYLNDVRSQLEDAALITIFRNEAHSNGTYLSIEILNPKYSRRVSLSPSSIKRSSTSLLQAIHD
jgi:hypothetical protein